VCISARRGILTGGPLRAEALGRAPGACSMKSLCVAQLGRGLCRCGAHAAAAPGAALARSAHRCSAAWQNCPYDVKPAHVP